jgi:hypothetical protein
LAFQAVAPEKRSMTTRPLADAAAGQRMTRAMIRERLRALAIERRTARRA